MHDFKMDTFWKPDNIHRDMDIIVSYLLDLCRMESTKLGQWLKLNLLVILLVLLKAEADFVPTTIVQNAVAKGAG